MHEDIMELPGTAAHEAVLKYELKKKCDPKEAQKDERKALKKHIEEGSPDVKK